MLYLNYEHLNQMGINWDETVQVIEEAVRAVREEEYVQPIKPYLRYKNPQNRIIAMPAWIGGPFSSAGIKWISSFPGNIDKSIPRAHCVTILNDDETGVPIGMINSGLISAIRTASVSGVMIKYYQQVRNLDKLNVGIIGFGPIGQKHAEMVNEILQDKLANIFLYDKRGIPEDLVVDIRDKAIVCHSWEEVYTNADLLITCTVSSERYINKKPKEGALLLNVSLRDYETKILDYTSKMIVDDWSEVCRENTDIERMHIERNLQQKDTDSLMEVVCESALLDWDQQGAVMFNPMGMAIFDIATASYYYMKAKKDHVGIYLEA